MSTTTLHRPEHVEVQLNDLQLEQAKKAATIGEFRDGFKQEAMLVMAEGDPETAKLVQTRIDVIAEGTKDQAGLTLATTQTNVLGQATINGGEEGIVMSEDMFGSITTMDEALIARQAAEHERRHGEQVPLNGDIVFRDKPITTWMLFEGDAELFGNEQVGWSSTFHRPGQPADYAAAQDAAYAIRQVIGAELWNQVLTKTGDTQALQEALNKAGQGVREREPAQVG